MAVICMESLCRHRAGSYKRSTRDAPRGGGRAGCAAGGAAAWGGERGGGSWRYCGCWRR